MGTAAVYADIYRKRLLGTDDFRDRIVDYMRTLIQESMQRSFPSGAVHDAQIDLTAGGTDRVTVGTGGDQYATDGEGHVLALGESSYMTAYFQNTSAVPYYVLLAYGWVPDGVQVNPRTGLPEYIGVREEIGFTVGPDSVSVVGGGTQLEFVVDSATEAGVSNAGRTVAVWKVDPGPNATTEAVAIQYLTVSWDGSNNKITTADLMGQTTASTTAGDYRVCLLGPSIKRNGSWDADSTPWCFIGEVTGAGAGNPPSSFDMSGQRVAWATLDDLADITSRHGTTNRLKIDVKSYAGDAADPQIAVRDTGGSVVFSVDGDGNMVVQGTTEKHDTVTVYSSETITDNLAAGDATGDSHTIKGTWRHTNPAGTTNYFRVDGTTGHVGINRLPDATAWFAVQGDVIAMHIRPVTTGNYDLGSALLEWRNFYVQTLTLSGDLDPASDGGPDIGDRTLRWNEIFAQYGAYPNNAAGYAALSRTMYGIELSSAGMDATNQYTTALKFMSTDPAFTTENPKLLGAIVGRATEAYAADTDGGMAIDFATTPDNPGATSVPVVGMSLDETGRLNVRQGAKDILGGRIADRLEVEYNPATFTGNHVTATVQASINTISGSPGSTALIGETEIDAASGTVAWAEGLYGESHLRTGSGASLTWGVGVSGWTGNRGTGTLTDGHALYAYNGVNSGGGSYVRQYGVYVEDMQAATDNYGLYVVGASTAAVYAASDKSYFVDATTVAGTIFASVWNPQKIGAEWAPGTAAENGQCIVGATTIDGVSGSRSFGGIGAETRITGTVTSGTIDSALGLYGQVDTSHTSGCTFSVATGVQGWVGNRSTGTIGLAAGLYAYALSNYGAGAITNAYGLYVENQTGGTNSYGVYVAGASTYAIWVDSGDTRLDGNLGVGLAPTEKLTVAGNTKFGTGPYISMPAYANQIDFSLNSTNYIQATNASGSLRFRTGGGNDALDLATTGRARFYESVGINVGPSTTKSLYVVRNMADAYEEVTNSTAQITVAGATSQAVGFSSVVDCDLTSGTKNSAIGFGASLDKDGAGILSIYYGQRSYFNVAGGTVNDLRPFFSYGTITAGTITDLDSFSASCDVNGGTVTNYRGLLFNDATTGSVSYQYGVRIENLTAGTVDNVGVYVAGASGGSGNNYAVWVDSGVTRLDGLLHLFTSTVGSPPANTVMVIENPADSWITFMATTSDQVGLNFGTAASPSGPKLEYDYANNRLVLGVNTWAYVENDGIWAKSIGINTTIPGSAGFLYVGDSGFYLNYNGTDPVINFDSTDQLKYDRSANSWIFNTAGFPALTIKEDSILIGGNNPGDESLHRGTIDVEARNTDSATISQYHLVEYDATPAAGQFSVLRATSGTYRGIGAAQGGITVGNSNKIAVFGPCLVMIATNAVTAGEAVIPSATAGIAASAALPHQQAVGYWLETKTGISGTDTAWAFIIPIRS